VCHELAHLCAPDTEHGPEFVLAYLTLTRACIGFAEFAALRSAVLAEPAFAGETF
jgi:hypothetical protein